MIEREPYSVADLRRISSTSVFVAPISGRGAAAHWLPLLALFTGARLEELGQLLVDDSGAPFDGEDPLRFVSDRRKAGRVNAIEDVNRPPQTERSPDMSGGAAAVATMAEPAREHGVRPGSAPPGRKVADG